MLGLGSTHEVGEVEQLLRATSAAVEGEHPHDPPRRHCTITS